MGKWSTYRRRGRASAPPPPPPPAQALLQDLQYYWELEEASGNRIDEVVAMPMAPNGTVNQIAGKIGNALECITGTTGVFRTPTPAFMAWSGAAAFPITISLWANRPTIVAADKYLIVVAGATNGDMIGLKATQAGEVGGWTRAQAGAYNDILSSGLGWVSPGWHHIIFEMNAPAGTTEIWFDNVSVATGTAPTSGYGSTTHAQIGTYALGGANAWLGGIDEVGWWSRILTSGERDALWNGGAGLPYSSFLP